MQSHGLYSHLVPKEAGHFSGLIDHMLYPDGSPDVERFDEVSAGRAVAEILKTDSRFKRENEESLSNAVPDCARVGEFTARHRLKYKIEDSEEHLEWFETRLQAIDQVESGRYLAENIKT